MPFDHKGAVVSFADFGKHVKKMHEDRDGPFETEYSVSRINHFLSIIINYYNISYFIHCIHVTIILKKAIKKEPQTGAYPGFKEGGC